MTFRALPCFKAYDVRGRIGLELDGDVAYRVGRSVTQHLEAKSVVVGFDARETSPEFASAVARGVIDIGLCGTEEMYWAVTDFEACAGIEVTASHNPIDYNGMKIVKSGSRPLDDAEDLQTIKKLASSQDWQEVAKTGTLQDVSTLSRERYVDRVLSFLKVENLKPLRIVVNSGNGAAGPTFDVIAKRLVDLEVPLNSFASTTNPTPLSPMAFRTHSFPKITRRLAMSFGCKALTLGSHLTATLIAAFFLMVMEILYPANTSWGS